MKMYSIQKRYAYLLLVIALGVGISLRVCATESFNFDTLFPTNAYSRATEQCVKVWGAWDALIHAEAQRDLTHVFDCSLGQLVLARTHLKHIPKHEKQPLAEQLHYISRVIGTIADRFTQLPEMDAIRQRCFKRTLSQLHRLIEKRMKQ